MLGYGMNSHEEIGHLPLLYYYSNKIILYLVNYPMLITSNYDYVHNRHTFDKNNTSVVKVIPGHDQ